MVKRQVEKLESQKGSNEAAHKLVQLEASITPQGCPDSGGRKSIVSQERESQLGLPGRVTSEIQDLKHHRQEGREGKKEVSDLLFLTLQFYTPPICCKYTEARGQGRL